MCWKGYSLYDCSAEFRLYWVQSKLAESGATEAHVTLVHSARSGGGGSSSGAGDDGAMQLEQQPAQPAQQQQQQQQTRRFLPLPAYRCTPGGLHMAHSHPVRCGLAAALLLRSLP
jgi:snurportin-1